MPVLYTINDIKQIFHCKDEKATKIVNLKGFPKIVIGKTTYVPKEALEKWIAENTNCTYNL